MLVALQASTHVATDMPSGTHTRPRRQWHRPPHSQPMPQPPQAVHACACQCSPAPAAAVPAPTQGSRRRHTGYSRSTTCAAVCTPPMQPALSPLLRPSFSLPAAMWTNGVHNNMHPAVVMDRITGARSAWGLQQAFWACRDFFSPMHYTAALLRLANITQGSSSTSEGSHQLPQHMPQPMSSNTGSPEHEQQEQEQQQEQDSATLHTTHASSTASPTATATITLYPPPAQQSLIHDLLRGIRAHMKELDPGGFANTMQALALLRHHDHQLIRDLLATLQPRLPQFTLQELAATIRGLALLQHQPSAAWLAAFYHAAGRDAAAQPSPPPQAQTHSVAATSSVVGVLWGLQGLGVGPPPAFVTQMLQMVAADQASPKEIAGLVHALAKLRFKPPAALLQQLQDSTQHSMQAALKAHVAVASATHGARKGAPASSAPAWQLQHCVVLFWGLSRLRVPLSDSWQLACQSLVLAQLRSATPQLVVMLLQALAAQHGMRTQAMAPRSPPRVTANQAMLQSMAALGIRPVGSAMRMQQAIQHAARHTQTRSAQESGAATTEHQAQGMVGQVQEVLTDAILAKVLRLLPDATPREIVLVLMYCAHLRVRPCHAWTLAALRRLEPNLPSMNTMDLALVAHSLGRLQATPHRSFLQGMLRASLRQMSVFTPQQLTQLCYGLAKLRAAPSAVWVQRALTCMHNMRAQLLPMERLRLLWAFQRLHLVRAMPERKPGLGLKLIKGRADRDALLARQAAEALRRRKARATKELVLAA